MAANQGPLARVLIGTDFSDGAAAAIERALRLPLRSGARVELFHVVPEPLLAYADDEELVAARGLLDDAVGGARATAARLGRPDLVVAGEMVVGRPYREILQQARGTRAQLVVVGRHGRRTVSLSLGSTAEHVARGGERPVLVVSRRPAGPYRRPLLCVDREHTAGEAARMLPRVLDPSAAGEELLAVHAVEPVGRGLYRRSGLAEADLAEWQRRAQADGLFDAVRFLAQVGGGRTRWRVEVRAGDPRAVLLEEARAADVDLLVVGTAGRGGLERMVLGSVAQQLLRAADRDVLVARASRPAEPER